MSDPHRIRIEPGPGTVRVEVDGVLVAESSRALVLHEGALPPRVYLPRDDVRMDLLVPSDTVTTCPFKGQAEHFSAEVGGRVVADVAWSYPDPIPDVAPIAGSLAFYDERDGVRVDTAAGARP